jgi:5-bromo-4-chloroindolyl phosphate hydrolysis protein
MAVKRYNPEFTKEVKGVMFNFFLFPILFAMVVALLKADVENFITFALSFLLFYLARKSAKIGFTNECAYHSKTVAKRPKPYKLLGALLLGIATSFTAYFSGDESFITALFLGIAAVGGFYLYYGFDPVKTKSIESQFGVTTEEVVEALDGAREKIDAIKKKIADVRDARLHKKISFALDKSRMIVDQLEQNPAALWSARKFLYVYLDGIIKVVDSYNEVVASHSLSDEVKVDLYMLFDKADSRFDSELERFKDQKDIDLSIEMEVLKKRLGENDG